MSQLLVPAPPTEQGTSPVLFAALYDELRRLAVHQLRAGGQAGLGTTSLVHEAFLDVAARAGLGFPDRLRFMGYAARAMRGIVIDHARRCRAEKRGGGADQVTLGAADALRLQRDEAEWLEPLSDALDELAALDPALAELVDLHFFCGFSFAEVAAQRGVSERTVQRDWRKARMLLHGALRPAPSQEGYAVS